MIGNDHGHPLDTYRAGCIYCINERRGFTAGRPWPTERERATADDQRRRNERPPHIADEWDALTETERADVITWAIQHGCQHEWGNLMVTHGGHSWRDCKRCRATKVEAEGE